jgi:hypothetical protein
MKTSTVVILIFSVVFLSIFLFCIMVNYHCTSTLIVDNQSGHDIHSLLAVWPDGVVTDMRGELRSNEKITMRHRPTSEGTIELLFKIADDWQWYHVDAGVYVVPNFGFRNVASLSRGALVQEFCPTLKTSELYLKAGGSEDRGVQK